MWRGSGLVAVVAVAAAVGPGLVANSDDAERRQRPEPSASAKASASPTPTPDSPSALRWRARGDLADDTEFVAAALAAAQRQEPTAEKVLYAGTLPDSSRLAFVAVNDLSYSGGLAFRNTGVLALHVPAGASVQDGRLSDAGGISSADDLTGWAGHVGNGRVVAVLLGRPAPLDAQISVRIRYRPDGSAGRGWRGVGGRDGSAVVELGRDVDPLVAARARNPGPGSYPTLMAVDGQVTGDRFDELARDTVIRGLGDSYAGPPARALRRAVVDGSWVLLDSRQADVAVLWSGGLGRGERGALLRLRRADGATFQLFAFQHQDHVFPEGVRHVPWAEADVLPWLFESGDPGRPMLLINPTGAGTASVSYPDEPPRVVTFGANGTARFGVGAPSAPNLYRAVIEVRAPTGELVVKSALNGVSNDDPFALDR